MARSGTQVASRHEISGKRTRWSRLFANPIIASSRASSQGSSNREASAFRISGESLSPSTPRPKVAQSRTSESTSLVSSINVSAATESLAKFPRAQATAKRTSAAGCDRCCTMRLMQWGSPMWPKAWIAASNGSGSVSRSSIAETTANDSSGKLLVRCSKVRPSCASTSAPLARFRGSCDTHHAAARSNTSRLPSLRRARTASFGGSES